MSCLLARVVAPAALFMPRGRDLIHDQYLFLYRILLPAGKEKRLARSGVKGLSVRRSYLGTRSLISSTPLSKERPEPNELISAGSVNLFLAVYSSS